MFRYIDHNPHDKNYPFTISDGWGGKVYMTKEDLANLQKYLTNLQKCDTMLVQRNERK